MHDTFFLWPVALSEVAATPQHAAARCPRQASCAALLDISKPNHHHLIKECQLNLLGHVARQVVASVAVVLVVVVAFAFALAVAGDAVAVAVPLTVSLTVAVAFAVAVAVSRCC